MNDIRKRLARIDKQLSRSPASYYRQITNTAPLLFCAVGLITGIILQYAVEFPALVWLALVIFCTVGMIAILIANRRLSGKSSISRYTLPCLALICFACVGAIRLAGLNHPKPNDIRNLVGNEPTLATVRGTIVTRSHINRRRWEFAKFAHNDPGSSFYLKITDLETTTGWANATGLVRVQVDEPVLDLKAGDSVQIYCWLNRFTGASNPGQFDTADYMAKKQVFIAASVKSRRAIELLQFGKRRTFPHIRSHLHQLATQQLTEGLPYDDPGRGLVEALLLGSRGNIDNKVYRAFEKTGLLHFISLSGMHLAIIVGIVWWLAKLAGLMKPGRAAVCIIVVIIFVLTVPPRDPTIRAAIITIVFCAAFFFTRRPSSLNSLSLAAIILLLIRPTALFDPGWQLSFASVLGILAFCRSFHFFLYEKTFGHPWLVDRIETKPLFKITARPGPYILALFTTGLSAWLGSAAILLYHFYTINPLTSIWTTLTFPLVAAILTFGFLKILLSFLLPTVAAALAVVVSIFANWLILVVDFIARLDISEILIGHTPMWLILLFYALVLFTGFYHFKRPLPKRIIFITTALVIIAYIGALKWQRTHRNSLTVTALDVSHGQALFAQLPGKTNILFDAGSLNIDDVGSRIVIPFLRYNGVSSIDAVVISHRDIDHINGIPEVVNQCKPAAIYVNDTSVGGQFRHPNIDFLFERLRKNHNKITMAYDNIETLGPATVKSLWPDRKICENNRISENDKSVVTMLEFAGRRVLICSDIEKFAQKEILRLYPDIQADVVIAPHHGSAKTTEPYFIEKIEPMFVICSCSRTSYEKGHVIGNSEKLKWYYTGKDGAVTARISEQGKIEINTIAKQK